MDLVSRVHSHGSMGTGRQDLSRPFAYNGDERREDFVPFRGWFRSAFGYHGGWYLGAGEDHGYKAKDFDKAREEMYEAWKTCDER